MLPVVLASQSPRRIELLSQLVTVNNTVIPNIDETALVDELPQHYVARLAQQKAAVGLSLCDQPCLVVGSDTAVVADGKLLGKPADYDDFNRMMVTLSDSVHTVYTAVASATNERIETVVVTTDVYFCALQQSDIDWYWQTGEPQDKAGGYGIQGLGGRYVKRIEGSYSSVVGLPLFETNQLLKAMRIV